MSGTTVTLTGRAPLADYQTAIRAVTFATTGSDLTTPRTIDVTVYDGNIQTNKASNTATATINMAPANVAPTAAPVTASGDEDSASISIALSASDTDGTIASYTISTLPANGTLYPDAGLTTIVGAGGTVTGATLYFVPASNWNGSTSFTYTATDNSGAVSGAATASLTVNPVNDAPVAVVDTSAVNEDASLSVTTFNGVIQGLGTDTDVDNTTGSLLVSGAVAGTGTVTQGAGIATSLAGTYGHLTLNADGSYTYIADQSAADSLATGVTATDVFTYTVKDPSNAVSNSTTLSITVTGTNDAPIAVADTGAVDEDATINVSAINGVIQGAGADSDVDNSTTSLTVSGAVAGTGTVTQGAGVGSALVGTYGTLTLNANGSYSYVADQAAADLLPVGTTANDVFTYTATDPGGLVSNTTTLTIAVTGAIDVPIAAADTGSTAEENPISGNVLSNDVSEEPGSNLTVSQFSVSGVAGTFSAGSTATISGVGALLINSDGSYTFTPVLNYYGTVPVATYTVADGLGNSSSSTLSLTVTPVNDDSVAGADNTVNVARDGNYVIAASEFGFNDPSDPDESLVRVRIDSLPVEGSLLYNNGSGWATVTVGQFISRTDIDNGYLVFKPDSGGTAAYASFTFTVGDADYLDPTPNSFTFNLGNELSVSDPLSVDEGKAAVFVVELSGARGTDTELTLTLGGEATTADLVATDPVFYRVQNADNTYGAWTVLPGSGIVTLPGTSTRIEVRVRTLSDAVLNEVESLTLTASITGSGSTADMANTTATGQTVISDTPSLLVSGASYVSEGKITSFDLELSSTKATDTTVTLSFAGVATVGADFQYSVDGGSTWITDATKVITIPGNASFNPSFEVLVKTISGDAAEIDELLTLIATTSDTGIANAGDAISAATYIVDPIVVTTTEDNTATLTPSSGYTYAVLGQGAHGTVTASGGNLVYTPALNYSGADSFTLSKTDAAGNVTTVVATVNVAAVADQPTISISVSEPGNDPIVVGATVAGAFDNGSFEYTGPAATTYSLSKGGSNWATDANLVGWENKAHGSTTVDLVTSGISGITDSWVLFAAATASKGVELRESTVGGGTPLTIGTTYTLMADVAINSGSVLNVYWGSSTTPLTYTLTPIAGTGMSQLTVNVTATATTDILRFEIPAGSTSGVYIDDVKLTSVVVPTYTYTVDVTAALTDTDGSEFLRPIVISSSDVSASAVMKLNDGTVLTRSGAGTVADPYSWTVPAGQADGLKLTMDKPASAGSFNLTATVTSEESSNASTAQNTATTVVTMPTDGPNDVPMIGDSEVFLSNEASFVGSMTATIDTYFSTDGGNTFSWNADASTLPNIYVDGQLVAITYDDATGTVTGTVNGGATTVFTVVIDLQDGGSNVTYTQASGLLGNEVVADGGIVLPGGGNGSTVVLGFKDASGNILYDAVLTSQNVHDGSATTVNTSSTYIGASNNLMNAGEQITMNFATAGVTYTDGVSTRNDVASMRISFFNFDSDSSSAPDELTITGTKVGGGTFTLYVTNADLDASGGYTVASPDGALIEKLVFEAGSQSSFKLGLESISSVQYDVDFSLDLGYTITDVNGDSDSGTINISLDGDNAMAGTDNPNVLLGGAGDDVITGGMGGDLIAGGAGNDTLSGGLNDLVSDTFKWSLADKGAVGSPAVDTITDFATAAKASGGDVLDLRDLLQGENQTSGTGNLADFLHFEKTGSDTKVHISSSGGFNSGYTFAAEDQTVLLQGVDLIGVNTTDAQIIQDLLTKGKLITDT
ncbi:MAG: tandem-95 repeat protein [Sulfuritalea sp.]|nr:tandem-95 repeat protein [Sulfuritalea sp.]